MKKRILERLLYLVIALALVFCVSSALAEEITEEACAHEYAEIIIREPTCDKDGIVKKTCALCEESVFEYTPAQHTLVEFQEKAPTCTEQGEGRMICSVEGCGYKEESTYPIIPTGHKAKEDCAVETTELACKTDSKNIYTCPDCNKVVEEYTEVVTAAPGHIVGNWQMVSATCDENAKIELYCTVCGELDQSVEVTLDEAPFKATGHVFGEAVPGLPATCYREGGSTRYCTVEGCDGYEVIDPIPMLEHTLEWIEAPAATCQAPGLKILKCTVEACGFVAEKEVIPQEPDHQPELPHAVVYKQPSCTEKGLGKAVCKWCGEPMDYSFGVIPEFHANTVVTPYEGQDSTCSVTGLGNETCTDCGADLGEVVIPLKDHTLGEPVVTEATCLVAGSKVYPCTVCEQVDALVEEIPATGHTPAETVTVAAVCLVEGHIDTICACGEVIESVPSGEAALEHIEGSRRLVPATCTDAGCFQIICALCLEPMREEAVFPALGHTLVGERVDFMPAKCEEIGFSGILCDVCGEYDELVEIPATGHSEPEQRTLEGFEPQCNQEGLAALFCPVCLVQQGEETFPVETVACEAWTLDTAPEEAIVLAPTCTEKGILALSCKWCFTPMGYAEIPAGCVEGDLDVTVEPDCVNPGEGVRYCIVCGEIMDEHEDIPATGHTPGEPEIIAATCSAEGLSEIKCAVCGIVTESKTLPLEQHNLTLEKQIIDPTCESDGYLKYQCLDCGAFVDTDSEFTLEMLGHIESEIPVIIDPTCATDGIGVAQYYCERCNEVVREEPTGLPQPEHVLSEPGILEIETCDEDGVFGVKCTVCGEYIETEVIPKLGHTEEKTEVIVKEATCLEMGVIEYYCQRCGVRVEVKDAPIVGHSYELSEMLIAPDCFSTGLSKQACKWCGEDGGYKIEPLTHTPKDELVVTLEPTCTEMGFGKLYCAVENCNALIDRTVPIEPTGHNFTVEVTEATFAPTCTQKGSKTYQCEFCGDVGEPQDVEALEHAWSDGVKEFAATCKYEAMTTKSCTLCGELLIDGTEVVTGEALPHTWNETEGKYNTKEPTCMEAGYVEKVCLVCGGFFEREILSELAEHEQGDGVVVDPTCTESGRIDFFCKYGCSLLMNTENTFPAKGHCSESEPNEVVLIAPTCKAVGKAELRCPDCDYLIEIKPLGLVEHEAVAVETLRYADCSIEQDGLVRLVCRWCYQPEGYDRIVWAHAFNWTTIEPTCVDEGYEEGVCNVCGFTEKTDIVEPLGHIEENEIIDPTCEADGSWNVICTREGCALGVLKQEPIPALGHDYEGGELDYVPAKCEEEGYTLQYCVREGCDSARKLDPIAALGHNWTTVETPAACDVAGEIKVWCPACFTVQSTDVIPALVHDWVKTTVVTERNCTDNETANFVCTLCLAEEVQEVPDTKYGYASHTLVEGEPVAPTKEAEGYTPLTCSMCGYVEKKDPTVLAFAKDDVELLEAANLDANVLASVPANADVVILAEEGSFYKVSYADEGEAKDGYIHKNFVEAYLTGAEADD